MRIDSTLRAHVEKNFQPLNKLSAAKAFPAMAALSTELRKHAPAKKAGTSSVNLKPDISAMFATASVDMWMRAVHSFLVSASVTNVSDIWASVTGYYSSHYSIRALAHLLGYFQLHEAKKTVQLSIVSGRHVCAYSNKSGSDREHLAYWRFVKRESLFATDPLFTENTKGGSVPPEVDHRDRANYIDHLAQFRSFRPLDSETLKNRVRLIAAIEYMPPPIPDVDHYPDINSVQTVAYHRLIRYRDLVDEILGGGNRFWTVNRNPTWASEYMDYTLVEQATLRTQFT